MEHSKTLIETLKQHIINAEADEFEGYDYLNDRHYNGFYTAEFKMSDKNVLIFSGIIDFSVNDEGYKDSVHLDVIDVLEAYNPGTGKTVEYN